MKRHDPDRCGAIAAIGQSLLLALLLWMAGCATDYEAPIEQKPALPSATRPARPGGARASDAGGQTRDPATSAVHVVASGDKLLTIAWRYGLDVRDLVRWNQISNPDLIVVGQTLRLRPPPPPAPPPPVGRVAAPATAPATGTVTARGAAAPPVSASTSTSMPTTPAPAPLSKPAPRISMAPMTPAPSVASPPASAIGTPPSRESSMGSVADTSAEKSAPAPSDAPAGAAANKAGVRWMWPAQGKVSAADAGSVTKGIDIRGARSQPVKAAAAGTVVYSGSGLRGYGELIIIQHNDTFLSAYAHNEARLVQEGRHVDAGETIARMGNSDTTDVMLHFEIRRNGKAVDPLQYLPNR